MYIIICTSCFYNFNIDIFHIMLIRVKIKEIRIRIRIRIRIIFMIFLFLPCVSTVIIVYIIISPLNSYLYIHWILDFKSIL